jgi:DNA-directed RNA polymerase specialized sigma24 family protein
MAESAFPDPDRPTLARIHAGATRRMRYHLRGWPAARIEEAVQDVCLGVLLYLRRNGPPGDVEWLVGVVSRRRAISMIRHERFERLHDPIDGFIDLLADGRASTEIHELREEAALLVHRILGFFRNHKAECETLAIARARGEDFKQVGARLGKSQAALLQSWSRCVRRLKDAARRGEIDLLGRPDRPRGGTP